MITIILKVSEALPAAPDLFYRDNARLRVRAREGQSKVGKSGEAVASPAAPNLSESQKGGCVPGVSP
jgi:hypothetical protein